MKLRHSFVSNSSTSSFLLIYPKDGVAAIHKFEDRFKYIYHYDIIKNNISVNNIYDITRSLNYILHKKIDLIGLTTPSFNTFCTLLSLSDFFTAHFPLFYFTYQRYHELQDALYAYKTNGYLSKYTFDNVTSNCILSISEEIYRVYDNIYIYIQIARM